MTFELKTGFFPVTIDMLKFSECIPFMDVKKLLQLMTVDEKFRNI